MKAYKILFLLFLVFMLFYACEKELEIDQRKPEINLNISDAFPVNCDTIYFGTNFEFKALLTDNMELGSYSLEIHHNFDHHVHSTEVEECNLGPIKQPDNPYTFIQDYSIPEGSSEYETSLAINVPTGDGSGLYDEGDYHFFISLTDKEGWSKQKGLSIKMLHR